MALSTEQISEYLGKVDENQAESIQILRSLVLQCEPDLDEQVCTDKWYGGLLVYNDPKGYSVYALGPRANGKTTFHMLPYYCSATYHERHGVALKKFLSGKSCLLFKHARELPLDSIKDILTGGASNVAKALAQRDESRKAKSKKKLS